MRQTRAVLRKKGATVSPSSPAKNTDCAQLIDFDKINTPEQLIEELSTLRRGFIGILAAIERAIELVQSQQSGRTGT